MKNLLILFEIGVGIFILAALISIGFYTLSNVSGANNAAMTEINQLQTEIDASDSMLLHGDVLQGSEVLSAVRKYQRKMTVTVQTKKGTTEYPGAGMIVVNDSDSPSYIAPDAAFTCTLQKNANDAVTKMIFIEVGSSSTPSGETITTLSAAKEVILNALGSSANRGMTWGQLSDIIRADNDVSAKNRLIAALGSLMETKPTWEELADQAINKIRDLQDKLAIAENGGQRLAASGKLSYNESITFSFTPVMISVITDTGAEIYLDGIWHGGGSVMLLGNTLTSNSLLDVSYYVYK